MVVAPCNARSPQVSDGSIRLDVLQGIPIADGVFLNGHGPYRFMLDTGAQTNQVEASLARSLGLTPRVRVDLGTVAGAVRVPGGRVATVSLGPNRAEDQEFLFTSLAGPRQLSPTIQGVLGQEFLSRFDYLLDLAGRRLVMGQPEPSGGNRLAFQAFEGCPTIQTSEGRLMMDSGTNAVLLFHPVSGPGNARQNGEGTVRTDSGKAAVTAIPDLRLRIAEREYRPTTAAATSPESESGIDGIFTASLFRSVYISNSGKYLIVDPNSH